MQTRQTKIGDFSMVMEKNYFEGIENTRQDIIKELEEIEDVSD